MAIDLSVNDKLEMKIYCRNEGQVSVNTRHYKVSALTGTGKTDADAAAEFSNQVAAAMRDCLAVGGTFLGISGQILRPIRRVKVVVTVDNGAGTFAGETLPRQVAGLIRLGSETASRHGRGRVYVPFPSEGANSVTGFPTGAYLTVLDVLRDKVTQNITVGAGANTVTLVPVLYHRPTGDTVQVTNGVSAQVWATQRRRSDIRGGDRSPF